MNIPEITERLLAAKKQKGLSFADLGKAVGLDEVWIAALFYRQASASEEEAQKLTTALDLGPDVAEALTDFPVKGMGVVVPADPLLYRFHEILQVYGMPLKAVIMNLLIDESGKVREVSLVEGPYAELNAAAITAARGFQFTPAMIQKKQVAVRIRYVYRFVLER